MKKFTFKLEKLLGYREHMLEKEKNALAALRSQMNALVDRRSLLKLEKDRLALKIKNGAEEGIKAGEIRTLHFQIDNIDHQIKAINTDIQRLSVRIEQQLSVVVEMSKDKKGLDILKEKELEEFNAEEAKATAEEIAEFVSNNLTRSTLAT